MNEEKTSQSDVSETNRSDVQAKFAVWPIDRLRPHPVNAVIYGAENDDNKHADAELRESIKSFGILIPLLVTTDGMIISGHRRYKAAVNLKLKSVPVQIRSYVEELEVKKALVHANLYRPKTNEQIGREFRLLKEIEAEEAKLRLKSKGGKNFSQAEKGKASDKAAAKLGVSGPTAEKAAKVVEKIDSLAKSDPVAAETLKKQLNSGSVDKAYKAIREKGEKKTKAVKVGEVKKDEEQGGREKQGIAEDVGKKLLTLKAALKLLDQQAAIKEDDVSEIAKVLREIAEQCDRICQWRDVVEAESK